MIFSFKRTLTATALVCASLAVVPADAKTFKWANSGDVSSMDPYARQETFLLTFTQNIYDPLVRRDRNLGLEPALAVKWGQSDPTTWFFDLRQGVKFTDGTPFTADDVVFSFGRITQPQGTKQTYVSGIKAVNKIDDHTVDLLLEAPTPMLLQNIISFPIMSKAWSTKNNTTNTQDYKIGRAHV